MGRVMNVIVQPVGGVPIRFAASELASHLSSVGVSADVAGDENVQADASVPKTVIILASTSGDHHHLADADADDRLQVHDPLWDDGFVIEIGTNGGRIVGTNPRSVLLGVYEYLRMLGFEWPDPSTTVRPRAVAALTAAAAHRASFRYRALCIEGSNSIEQIEDVIDWLPKVGFNGYFLQFRDGYVFFDRWYSTREDWTGTPEAVASRQAEEFRDRVTAAVRRRGLQYHRVGHGWTCEPFGLPGRGWYRELNVPVENVQRRLALVDGKRELWRGVPLDTNLCMSQDDTRAHVVDDVVSYAQACAADDIVHVWLADGANNHCECEACAKRRPADWYVLLLNEIDERLDEHRLPCRIAFLAYADLLWPPLTERIRNADRFIIMFAPITRDYNVPYRSASGPAARGSVTSGEPSEYRRNALRFPTDPDENSAFVHQWRRTFAGDAFAFEYHLYTALAGDLGGMTLARVVSEDIDALAERGFSGLISCQAQRVGLYGEVPAFVMARRLWDRSLPWESLAARALTAVYGADAPAVMTRRTNLSRLLYPYCSETGLWTVQTEDTLSCLDLLASSGATMRERSLGALVAALVAVLRTYHVDQSGFASAVVRLREVCRSIEKESPLLFDAWFFLRAVDYHISGHRVFSEAEHQQSGDWRVFPGGA